MKTRMVLKSLADRIHMQMAMGIIVIMACVPASRAGLTGPYTNDFYTLHLWHLQDTNGTIPGVATNGVYFYDSANNPLVVPLLISNTPGPALISSTASPTNFALAGQPGPGATPLFQQLYGTNFGYALSVQNTQQSGFFAPWDNVGNSDYPDLSYAQTNNASSFGNTNTGAFTWEALIQPNFNALTYTADKNPEILCMDGPDTTGPGKNPYTERAIQFRFDNATPSSGLAELEFNGNISAINSQYMVHDVFGLLPLTGPDALVQGTWYHVAAAFTGTAPTNGDPPNVLTLYWTKFDAARTNADVLTNFSNFYMYTNSGPFYSLPYPSNSIIGTAPFVIGNSARLSSTGTMGGGWIGNMAEVRISDCYRHPNEFMFNSSVIPSPPYVVGPTTNTLVGYGQTLNLNNLQVSGTLPYAYQWYEISSGVTNPLAGQTNLSLVLNNITYAANNETFFAIVTNAYGSATSAVASVQVGATFEGFYNTGCDANDNPLDQTAPGSVDLHWIFTANPDNNSSNAIVWGDGSPLGSGGGVGPDNGASVWIWAHENSGKVAGTYTLQTTFQIDETAISAANSISGTVGLLGATNAETLQMFLNGVETDYTMPGNPAETVLQFNITNGLQPGSNTLVCTAYQSGVGTAGNNGFNLDVLSDTGAALTNAPFIINQPASTTSIYGSTASFQAVALGAPPLTYYWLSNGVAITPPVWIGTALPELSFVATNFAQSELVGTNFFANYQIVFSNFVGSVTSAVATLDIQLPPLTVSSAAVPVWSETNIMVYFSTAVDPATALNAANYSLNNGATVESVVLGNAPGEVILTTTPLTPGVNYQLTVQNVESLFYFAMSGPETVTVGTYTGLLPFPLSANQEGTVTCLKDPAIQYKIYLPPGYSTNGPPLPIIYTMAPNGGGEVSIFYSACSNLNIIDVGLINPNNNVPWNVVLRDFFAVPRDIRQRVLFDPTAVFVGGLSGGGENSYIFSRFWSQQVSGVLPMGGWLGYLNTGPSSVTYYSTVRVQTNLLVARTTGTSDTGGLFYLPYDKNFLTGCGAIVSDWSFSGGHTYAPTSLQIQCLQWLLNNRIPPGPNDRANAIVQANNWLAEAAAGQTEEAVSNCVATMMNQPRSWFSLEAQAVLDDLMTNYNSFRLLDVSNLMPASTSFVTNIYSSNLSVWSQSDYASDMLFYYARGAATNGDQAQYECAMKLLTGIGGTCGDRAGDIYYVLTKFNYVAPLLQIDPVYPNMNFPITKDTPGLNYSLQWEADLTSGTWTNNLPYSITDTDTVWSATMFIPDMPEGFYRVATTPSYATSPPWPDDGTYGQ